MEIVCLYCNKIFSRMPHRAKTQRFCSRECWFNWHRGENNDQTNRIAVNCSHCGKIVNKVPSKVGKFNYCSRKCASVQHGKKITGESHPNWKGGRLDGRGPSWLMARIQVIARQNGICGNCPMTEEEHRAKYGKSFDVHHRSPYRLDQNNHPDNLIALCATCHGAEEAATRRKLSPEEWAKIRQTTAEKRAAGLDRYGSAHTYNLCACGNKKMKDAILCRSCRNKERAQNRLPHFYCGCGAPKMPRATRCWNCRIAKNKVTD